MCHLYIHRELKKEIYICFIYRQVNKEYVKEEIEFVIITL